MSPRIDAAHDSHQSARAIARAALERALAQVDTAEVLTVRGSEDRYLQLSADPDVSLDLSLEFGSGHLRVSACSSRAPATADI